MHDLHHAHLHSRGVAQHSTNIVARAAEDTSEQTASLSKADISFFFSQHLNGVDQDGNYKWSRVLVWSIGILSMIILVGRIWMRSNNHLRHLASIGAGREQAYWAHNQSSFWPKFKKHFLYAPLFRNRHNREFQLSAAINVGTLPSRFHTILLIAYSACNLAYCLALPWTTAESASVIAALRGRTGTLAMLNVVPTVLFALRNNPLIHILHVSYDTFNLLHRWFARISVFQAVVHTLCWLINTVRGKGWSGVGPVLAETPSYAWGLLGTCAFVALVIQAWSPIRHAFYETFLAGHRLLVLFALIGVYVHIDTHKLPQMPWMQTTLLLWGLEWGYRCFRIIYLNMSVRQITSVTVEAMPGEACRVTCRLVRPWGKVKPGSHVHIYLPAISLFSSHPFSVAWSDTIGRPEDEKLPTTEKNETVRLESQTHNSISLVIRARSGMTRTLYDKASKHLNGVMTTYGMIEGPYGGHESLKSYGTTVLFAAGVGITHQVSQVRTLVAGFAENSVATKKIILVWSVPNTEVLEWVRPWMDEILKMPGRRDCLKILLFVSKPRSHAEIVSSGTGTVQMFPGRCNAGTVLDKELESRVGATCVTVCGPGAFADSVRAAVRERVEVGVVDFIEEAFTY